MSVLPILIAISGVKSSGKDTTADFITEWVGAQSPALSVVRRGFADKGKWAFARQFFPEILMEDAIAWVNKYKNENKYIVVPRPDYAQAAILFRDAIAQFCTEGGRDIYGQDHWVDQLLPLGQDKIWTDWPRWFLEFQVKLDENTSGVADICLITDMRFENEMHRVEEVGGICIKINRKDAEDKIIEEARKAGKEIHRSELGILEELFDVVIENNDDLESLRIKVFHAMERLMFDKDGKTN